jgi:hypothetical protein
VRGTCGGRDRFDVGPANALLDGVVRTVSGGRETFDRGGRRAARGRPDAGLLERLLADAFLRRAPPKSTGRERYGLVEAEALVRESRAAGRSEDDLLATLVAFSVEAVRRACQDFLSPGAALARLYVGGGGAENPVFMAGLARALAPAHVAPMDAGGVRRARARRWRSRCSDATRCSVARTTCRAAPAPPAPPCWEKSCRERGVVCRSRKRSDRFLDFSTTPRRLRRRSQLDA